MAADFRTMAVSGRVDAAELERLLEAEGRRLFSIALAILRDPVEAEDAVQETALAAWRGWEGRTDPERSRAWLTTICVRQAIRRRSMVRRWLRGGERRDQVDEAERHLEGGGAHLDLHRAYATLSPKQRAVVALHYGHGYTLTECAELMGCSGGAVASHLSRALARLRKELSDE
ncbi:MAG TPA: sigma-70 family RNA polymerase sigma factor [Candidatus Binatia bacterium]|nr:sigma-70 family RNA polymerase sigma factor [Candidatus Binatia bacterium]